MRPTLDQILDAILESCGIRKEIYERDKNSRLSFIVKVKQTLCYIGQEYGYSQPKIGEFLNINHSTVHHNKETAKGYMKYEREYESMVYDIMSQLMKIQKIEYIYRKEGEIVRNADGIFVFSSDGESYAIAEDIFPHIDIDSKPQLCEITLRLK